jgi:galactose mutarotase-like enzyme
MLYTIENKHFICLVESIGAEVRSLKNKETQEEYIWQINNTIWGSSSPVLFPSIGNIKSNKITYKGEEFSMPKHGIIRNNKHLNVHQISASKCTFTLMSSQLTKEQYPFDFSFTIIYELTSKGLQMTYEIVNEDVVPIIFSCGGHTAYACPIDRNTKLSDYIIEFPNTTLLHSLTLGDSGLLTKQLRTFELQQNQLELSEILFNEDALVFANINFEWVRLRKKKQTKGIKVVFKNYPNLALWSKPGADYICIEPWLGLPDMEDESIDISQKTNYKKIQPKTQFSISIATEIE